MNIFNLFSMLLDYPDASMRKALSQGDEVAGTHGAHVMVGGPLPAIAVVELSDTEGLLSADERRSVAALVERIQHMDLTDLQAEYVRTFDLAPEHSLHVTHHIHGEERTRGPALIDLSEYYKSYGLINLEGELPDYLPLMLEFASLLDIDEARVFLGDIAKVLDTLADNLEKSGSPYATLIRIIERQGHLLQLAA